MLVGYIRPFGFCPPICFGYYCGTAFCLSFVDWPMVCSIVIDWLCCFVHEKIRFVDLVS